MNAEPVMVKKITLTPFTLVIDGEVSEDEEKRKEYSEKYDKWHTEEGGWVKGLYGVKYKDDTVVRVTLVSETTGIVTSTMPKGYWANWSTPVDIDNVAAILFGENGEISLELGEPIDNK